MGRQVLEVKIMSAQDLKDASTPGKLTLYAYVGVHPCEKTHTKIDFTAGGLDEVLVLFVPEQPYATLNMEISGDESRFGSCSVPLNCLKDGKGTDGQFISVLVCGPSGQTEWLLNLSLKLGDVNQPPAMSGEFAPVPQTGEPINIRSSTGYNQAAGNQYPQYSPRPPRKTGLFDSVAKYLLCGARSAAVGLEIYYEIAGGGLGA
jgi:hypothetical protein